MNLGGQSSAVAGAVAPFAPCSRGEAEVAQRPGGLRRIIESLLALLKSVKVQRRKRQMSLCETLPLGEKRFLAIVEIDQERLLIAATDHSISLLQRLDTANLASQAERENPNQLLTKGWR